MKNTTQPHSFNINSSFFLQQFDSTVIQLIKVLAVEHQISINDAKKMTYDMLLDRINMAMLNDNQKLFIKETIKRLRENIRGIYNVSIT